MRITESQLRKLIKREILREFLGQGAGTGVGVPEIEAPLDRGSSSIVKFSAYMTQGSDRVTTSKGQFDYNEVMSMSPGDAFDFFNGIGMIKLMMDFKREYLAVPESEDGLVRTLTRVPFGGVTRDPPYVLKYKELEPQLRADFRSYDACVLTRMGSLGSTIFASCPNEELVSPAALDALAQHVLR